MEETKKCLGKFEMHSWSHWVPFDPIHELKWGYRRDCQLLGCSAIEYVQDLKPVGMRVIAEDGKMPT